MREEKLIIKKKALRKLLKATRTKMIPIDLGIQGFKRLLKENPNLTKAQRNKAAKMYKQRAYERLEMAKKHYEEVMALKGEEAENTDSVDATSLEEAIDKKEEV